MDVWKAVERGIIDTPLRPWLGYFMLVEDNDAWNRPSGARQPVWPADPVFDGTSAANRATIFFDRLVRERLLDAACVVLANRSTGEVRYPQQTLSFDAFAAAMFGRCLQFKATNPDLPWTWPPSTPRGSIPEHRIPEARVTASSLRYAPPMGSDDVAIAVAQVAPGDDKASNLADIRRLATHATERGAKLVVFPEYSSFFVPELGEASVAAAEPLDGPFVTALSSMAAELGVHLVAGMLETTSEGSRVSNTLVAFNGSGALVAKYRKLHLYDAFGQKESDWVVAGAIEKPETFAVEGLTVGLQTCYDIRFPEVTRRLVDAGADLVLLPSEWVRGPLKEYHWRTLVTARALENTVYLAAADQAPPIGAGNSMIVDPMGVELVTIGDATDVAIAWISPSRIAAVRAVNPALHLRRFRVVPHELIDAPG